MKHADFGKQLVDALDDAYEAGKRDGAAAARMDAGKPAEALKGGPDPKDLLLVAGGIRTAWQYVECIRMAAKQIDLEQGEPLAELAEAVIGLLGDAHAVVDRHWKDHAEREGRP